MKAHESSRARRSNFDRAHYTSWSRIVRSHVEQGIDASQVRCANGMSRVTCLGQFDLVDDDPVSSVRLHMRMQKFTVFLLVMLLQLVLSFSRQALGSGVAELGASDYATHAHAEIPELVGGESPGLRLLWLCVGAGIGAGFAVIASDAWALVKKFLFGYRLVSPWHGQWVSPPQQASVLIPRKSNGVIWLTLKLEGFGAKTLKSDDNGWSSGRLYCSQGGRDLKLDVGRWELSGKNFPEMELFFDDGRQEKVVLTRTV